MMISIKYHKPYKKELGRREKRTARISREISIFVNIRRFENDGQKCQNRFDLYVFYLNKSSN